MVVSTHPIKHKSLLKSVLYRTRRKLGTLGSTNGSRASFRYLNDTHSSTTSRHRLTAEQHRVIDAILRVDQAGELAANWIYKGQHTILGNDPNSGPLIQVWHIYV